MRSSSPCAAGNGFVSTPEEFFAGSPAGLALYRAVAGVISSIGPAEVRVTKSQVAFRRRKGFAFVWRPGQYVKTDVLAVLSFGLPREVRAPPVQGSRASWLPGCGCTISSCGTGVRSTPWSTAGSQPPTRAPGRHDLSSACDGVWRLSAAVRRVQVRCAGGWQQVRSGRGGGGPGCCWSAPGREDGLGGDAEVHGEVRLDVAVRLAAPGMAEHGRVHGGAGAGPGGVGMAGRAGQRAARGLVGIGRPAASGGRRCSPRCTATSTPCSAGTRTRSF